MMQIIRKLSEKLLLVAVLLVICTTSALAQLPSANQLVLQPKPYSIPFQWQGDSANGQWEPHSVLLLPVKLPSCPGQFYMQFDLGSPYSMVYRGEIEMIRAKYPSAIPKADSSIIKDCKFQVGNMPVTAKEMAVKDMGQHDSKNNITIIGTIGADFIEGRMIMIDYPHQKLFSGIKLPSTVKPLPQLTSFMYVGGSILLPALVGEKNTMLFFDTGSSAFELITDKETANLLAAPSAAATQFSVRSWNRVLTAFSLPATGVVKIAALTIALKKVSYIEGASSDQINRMMKMGIGGMTGNKLFINHTLVLDMKNKKLV